MVNGNDKPNIINLLDYFFDNLPVLCCALATSISEDDVDRRYWHIRVCATVGNKLLTVHDNIHASRIVLRLDTLRTFRGCTPNNSPRQRQTFAAPTV